MSSRVTGSEPHQRPASMRIKMRCTLAHQIRGPKQTRCTSRRSGGFGAELLVRIAVIIVPVFPHRSEAVAKPAERKACGLRDTHHVPAVWHRMTERVHTSPGVKCRSVSSSEDYAGGANRGAH